jgi:mRNA-degrading endonuclease RelE of RelBE toxin-antitoxin system
MKLSYEVFIRHEVYRALQGASAHDQERVSDFIESLAGNPFREGDATIPDEHGRTVQVKMLGRLVLFYWADHAEKEVRVVDLANADG